MDVSHFLNSHLLDVSVGGKKLWADMLEQAVHAEAIGFRGVSVPEHHLLNILLVPSPLQFAVAIAARTQRIEIASAVCQLPIRDMRIFAGEVVQAQALCGGRLVLGVGKGAFGFETGRIGVPMEETKPRFEESLAVLEALLTREEVSWAGQWYKFDALTVMPRPEDPIPIALAIMAPPGIEAAAAQGYHVQTTPLSASHGVLEGQVAAFHRGAAMSGKMGQRLSLQRGLFVSDRPAEIEEMVTKAYKYYESFDNVFGGPGIVDRGVIRPLPRSQSVEEFRRNVLICGQDEMIDRLSAYAELGIDEVIASSNFGQAQGAVLEMMSRLAVDVMPKVAKTARQAA
ncbi:MAG: LLM class flavin-dependent oxidoreductase [Tabrizicola sp.]|nr:LLM class flavin-dependent oxidoreductase [Tabrizicola sp.]